jgi:hypothetical protein
METIGNLLKHEIEHDIQARVRSNKLFLAAEQGALTPLQIRTYVSGILFQIRATMGVLRRAEERALAVGDKALAAHYHGKFAEENGHDQWAEKDLESLPGSSGYGTDPSTMAVGRLVSYLREIVDRDPALFLSYILLAEYLTVLVGPDWLRALESKCGVAPSQISVVANHVELDRDHVAEGVRTIDMLVTSPDKGQPMLDVIRQSVSYYEEFWNEVVSTRTKAA